MIDNEFVTDVSWEQRTDRLQETLPDEPRQFFGVCMLKVWGSCCGIVHSYTNGAASCIVSVALELRSPLSPLSHVFWESYPPTVTLSCLKTELFRRAMVDGTESG